MLADDLALTSLSVDERFALVFRVLRKYFHSDMAAHDDALRVREGDDRPMVPAPAPARNLNPA